MSYSIDVDVRRDEASQAVEDLRVAIAADAIKRAVGSAVTRLFQDHLDRMPHNKRGWPPQGFYAGAARGCGWDKLPEGVLIYCDNELHPGAMRQRFHGGKIRAKRKLLSIPARQEFYGHSPSEFTNLRFVAFRSGSMALVIGKGGAGLVDFGTGKQRSPRGAGARAQAMVAYWLRDEVDQEADPSVLPTDEEITDAALEAVAGLVAKAKARQREGGQP